MKFSNEYIPQRQENIPRSIPNRFDLGNRDIYVRDPFIMPFGGKYYLYRNEDKDGIVCHVSEDLENWSEPVFVFVPPKDFHGTDCFFWAPECHYYNGYFYIFTSVKSSKFNDHRVISVYRADNPLGPFEDIAGGCISPADWDSIDGTLYMDKDGQPWMVFVHEWTDMPDKNGSIVAAKLSNDFTSFISEPVHLFYAMDNNWETMGCTDGPFLYRTDSGRLLMIWSNYVKPTGYAVLLAYSETGDIIGPWKQEKILYQKNINDENSEDGGHGMIFRKDDGSLAMSIHSPNQPKAGEHCYIKIVTIKEKDGTLVI